MTAPHTDAPILLVEDEPEQLELLSLFLEIDGYQVDVASNGQQGWDMFCDGLYQLVVTNQAMPIMNGEKLTAEVEK